jgi:hypothetical protein
LVPATPQAQEKAAQLERLSLRSFVISGLLDDLDYAARAGVNQNRSIIDDRVAIFANTVFWWNFIVGDARFRKYCAHPHITFVAVRGPVFFDDIMPEARALIDAENSRHTADDPSDRAANNSSHRPGSPLALSCTAFDASGYALG